MGKGILRKSIRAGKNDKSRIRAYVKQHLKERKAHLAYLSYLESKGLDEEEIASLLSKMTKQDVDYWYEVYNSQGILHETLQEMDEEEEP